MVVMGDSPEKKTVWFDSFQCQIRLDSIRFDTANQLTFLLIKYKRRSSFVKPISNWHCTIVQLTLYYAMHSYLCVGIRVFVFVYLYICMFSVYLCVSVFSFATRVWWNKMNIIYYFVLRSMCCRHYSVQSANELSNCLSNAIHGIGQI